MTEANRELQIKLDPKRLATIVDNAVVASSEIVNFHFNALSDADLGKPATAADAVYKFPGPQRNADQRRAMHENWILARAFQELLRAVRHALEEAHIFSALLTKKHKIASNAPVSEFLRVLQSKASSLRFPDLLAAVNDKLEPKLIFADSYKSLQSARNCLEHRDGIVGKKDTHGKDTFTFSVPRLKIFFMRGGDEVEIAKGEVIEAGKDQAHVQILTRLDVRKRSVALGERITFTLPEFNEIAFACHFLGQQLASKLPKPKLAES